MFERFKRRFWIVPYVLLHMRSRRAIESWQLQRLQTQVAFARRLPMYASLYEAGHAPETIKFLADVGRLPVVTKAMFAERDAASYTSAVTSSEWATTSGTSGEPFNILVSMNPSRMRADFTVYRPLFWGSLMKRDGYRMWRIFTKTRPRSNRQFTHITEFLKDPEAAIHSMIDWKPDVIETFASILEVLVDTVEMRGLPLRVRYAITGGERITQPLRERIERVLGCEVFDRYGMEEFDVVGAECAKHNGFHTNCETLYVEVVDEAGAPVADGESGRILVTDLYNRAMPFIRYDTGDKGRMDRSVCSCGSHAPRVWIDGRNSASLMFNGRKINHLEFDDALEMYMHAIKRYLVVKHSDTELEVQIIPASEYSESIAEEINEKIRVLVGDGVDVRVAPQETLPTTKSGKSRIVLDASLS